MSNSSNKNIKEWATYFLEGYELIVGPILLTSKNESLLVFIGGVKRAPHWGVQSRFRVIYMYTVCMSTIVYGKPIQKFVC